MLREEDLMITQGRVEGGGGFIQLSHTPTGIQRGHFGPLRGVSVHKLLQDWQEQIEAEILSKGLTEFIIEPYRTKAKGRSK